MCKCVSEVVKLWKNCKFSKTLTSKVTTLLNSYVNCVSKIYLLSYIKNRKVLYYIAFLVV